MIFFNEIQSHEKNVEFLLYEIKYEVILPVKHTEILKEKDNQSLNNQIQCQDMLALNQ